MTTNDEAAKPKRQRLTDAQKIEQLQRRIASIKTRTTQRSRQMDTREKVVIGGAVVRAMREDEAFRSQVVALLQANVTRDSDREAIASWLAPTSTPR